MKEGRDMMDYSAVLCSGRDEKIGKSMISAR